MKVLVIEDEIAAYNNIKKLILNSYDRNLVITAWLTNVEDAITWLTNNQVPDLILLDIHLSDGLSFSIFDHVSISSPVVFTTAYDEYAIKAFDFNAIDYLLKPISQVVFDKMIQKVQSSSQHFQLNKKIIEMLSESNIALNYRPVYKQRFLVRKNNDIYLNVKSDDISFIYIDNVVFLVNINGQKYIINYSLDHLMTALDPDKFFRANRRYIIHIDAIVEVITYFNNSLKVVLNNSKDHSIVINKDKVRQFKEWAGQ